MVFHKTRQNGVRAARLLVCETEDVRDRFFAN
jgi:hypothetical protein